MMTDSKRVDDEVTGRNPQRKNVKPTIVPDAVSSEDVEAEELFITVVEPRYDAVAELGRAFVTDSERSDAMSKLGRYETALLRGVDRTLHQLHAAQAARVGQTDQRKVS